ncbi:MAG: prolyl oligopeptidase family serine peptidase [Thermomicrobiales bacterium]
MTPAPYGSWSSPITSELIVAGTISLVEVSLDGDDVYWIEGRPTEAGRRVIVRRTPDGRTADVIPAPFNARTRVHEYGGGVYIVVDGTIYFTNFADQRLYSVAPGGKPEPVTPDVGDAALRFADFALDRTRNQLIFVREDHREAEAEASNAVVALDLAAPKDDGGRVLVAGNDFYSTPRVSPDGSRLAWLTWNHPNMPWDGCELWVADLTDEGGLANTQLVAGGQDESIFQPAWSPDGVLHFVSDRTGWWNLYRSHGGAAEPLAPMEAEFGLPQWVFSMATYGFASAETIACTYSRHGTWHFATLDLASRRLEPVETPFTEFGSFTVGDGFALVTAGSPTESPVVARIDLATGGIERLRSSSTVELDEGYLSAAEPIAFATQDGGTAYGFFYAPRNKECRVPEGELPPLVVISHGGPTGQTDTVLDLSLQYWTSRGFAVLDVDYGGSTGYGRAYRERLNGRWGIVDVDDCIDGAHHLVKERRVDGNRLAIRGWSASGYTTLAALTFREVFKAGASHYGVSELEAMAKDTHKFESRYLDRLIGPYPERKDLYTERSPLNYVHRMTAPLILFQGLEDKVVPPNQAELMYDAVKAKGLPVALVEFAGEQHGFRQAANIRRALDGELYFLGKVFGFEPADAIEPVPIANVDA